MLNVDLIRLYCERNGMEQDREIEESGKLGGEEVLGFFYINIV